MCVIKLGTMSPSALFFTLFSKLGTYFFFITSFLEEGIYPFSKKKENKNAFVLRGYYLGGNK